MKYLLKNNRRIGPPQQGAPATYAAGPTPNPKNYRANAAANMIRMNALYPGYDNGAR